MTFYIQKAIADLTVRTGFHGKLFFAFLHKYPLFIGSLERSDRDESGISRTFEKVFFGEVMTERKIGF